VPKCEAMTSMQWCAQQEGLEDVPQCESDARLDLDDFADQRAPPSASRPKASLRWP
jgi:hypothetical protein